MIVLAVYAALRLDAATGTGYEALFSGERFSYPTGYPNANAAQWLMAFWPALLLARGQGASLGPARAVGGGRGGAGRLGFAEPQQRLAVCDVR